jgi:hypothetical protein
MFRRMHIMSSPEEAVPRLNKMVRTPELRLEVLGLEARRRHGPLRSQKIEGILRWRTSPSIPAK